MKRSLKFMVVGLVAMVWAMTITMIPAPATEDTAERNQEEVYEIEDVSYELQGIDFEDSDVSVVEDATNDTEVTNEVIDVEEVAEEEPIEEPKYEEYTVQSGDSFWSIAKRLYGNGNYYIKIMKDNGYTSSLLPVGAVLYIYELDEEPMKAESIQYSAKYTPAVVKNSPPTNTNSVAECVAQIKDFPNEDTSGMKYVGNFRVTGYDPYCKHCCGKSDGITSSGRKAEYGVTVGCNSLPAGTQIYLKGYGYFRVDDTGGMANNVIDVACHSHDVCYQMTNNSVEVYIVQ